MEQQQLLAKATQMKPPVAQLRLGHKGTGLRSSAHSWCQRRLLLEVSALVRPVSAHLRSLTRLRKAVSSVGS